ncbi:tRNA (adenosine(37)-N6)-threonylcarbamoyltransferase complex ATPase subunit type 1 TsaE [Candidatus Saccharibacteria bacterium]|nr:tRNA (adenosine(37)-N6)-threonylcarbamoyltransferase complex ATPase subunit type 1 TsaE [Candidatus Saccharibacteria bacterium]MCL1963274.1 tRNA (adenosine(37)-N6)-threonylcarbamoyltransferase complex ATPase subunit type 1 TsaE [Candidatus Saccharibacteria bacterium]
MKILSDQEMRRFSAELGAKLRGGEIIELVGDIGAGKTTFVKGLAMGLGVDDDVQSPSFTINRKYDARDGLILNHYDFYRLNDAGILNMEIAESIEHPKSITVIEWGETVRDVLPNDRIVIRIDYLPDVGREIVFEIPEKFAHLC